MESSQNTNALVISPSNAIIAAGAAEHCRFLTQVIRNGYIRLYRQVTLLFLNHLNTSYNAISKRLGSRFRMARNVTTFPVIGVIPSWIGIIRASDCKVTT